MKNLVFSLLIAACALQLSIVPAEAGRKDKCEGVGHYEPPKGVYKFWSRKIKKEWETRYHCLPCGRKVPYKVQVITYRDRYSNGVSNTWKCVVRDSEVALGK